MPCCRCNASGKCANCKCVKEGSKCLDCLPGRLGKCLNPVDSMTADDSSANDLQPHDSLTNREVPSGKQGQAFVSELAKLYGSFGEATSMESIALKAAMVLPSLILQKPSRQSKTKDHILCIQRRLQLWGNGEVDKLIAEVRAIQSHLPPISHYNN